MDPEFMSDALDDLRDDYLARIKPAPVVPCAVLHPDVRRVLAEGRRLLGIGDPARVGGTGLDFGFLLACNDLAPDIFANLVVWRGGPSVADEHATGRPVAELVTPESMTATRHAGYVAGVRDPAPRETREQQRAREVAEDARKFNIDRKAVG